MKFDPTTRTLTLEKRDCRTCEYGDGERGQYTRQKPCGTCKGSGRGPRGGLRGCRSCSGFGKQNDWGNPRPCPTCGGDWENFQLESFTDYLPAGVVGELPVRLVRQDRAGTWNEAYLGFGSLFSVTDYGRRWDKPDFEVQHEVWKQIQEDATQACKVLQPYERGATVATLHEELVILLHRDGYSVVAHTPQEATS